MFEVGINMGVSANNMRANVMMPKGIKLEAEVNLKAKHISQDSL